MEDLRQLERAFQTVFNVFVNFLLHLFNTKKLTHCFEMILIVKYSVQKIN